MFKSVDKLDGVFVADLPDVRGSVPTCSRCSRTLSKSLFATVRHSDSIVAFWYARCPDCKAGHIIFNETCVLPPVTAPTEPLPDPAQP